MDDEKSQFRVAAERWTDDPHTVEILCAVNYAIIGYESKIGHRISDFDDYVAATGKDGALDRTWFAMWQEVRKGIGL